MKPERRRSRSRTRVGVAAACGVVGAGLVASWLVLREWAVLALSGSAAASASLSLPNDPRIVLYAARAELETGAPVPPRLQPAVKDALKREPLAYEPLLSAAVDDLAAGRSGRARELLLEAQRRNPRSPEIHTLLLQQDVQDNRPADAARHLAVIQTLRPGATGLLVAALAQMVKDPGVAESVTGVLSRAPALKSALLDQLVASGAKVDLVMLIAGEWGRIRAPAQPWRGKLIERLVKDGEPDEAIGLWRRASGDEAAPFGKGIYDGDFRGLVGDPPFNWTFSSTDAGAAGPIRPEGLDVTYYGRSQAEVAHQLMALRPGAYSLTFTAEGDAKGDGSRLQWALACYGTPGGQLLALPVTGVSSAPTPFRASFTVPAQGCRAQWLTLLGTPGEVPSTQAVTIRHLRIAPGGGGK